MGTKDPVGADHRQGMAEVALREHLIEVDDAVARSTARPADLLGLDDRGRIHEGLRADLVLLDPTAVIDTATFDDPHRAPAGVVAVIIGGQVVYRDGRSTGARPGRIIRTPRASGRPLGG